MKKLENILNRFDIAFEKHHLLQALTHNSFSDKNNSRYAFLGQFAFKGKVAGWIFDNVAGTGTQLQHFLGNIFSHTFLETYFDKNFDTIKRIDATVNINTQKHIFTTAFFGLVYDNATDDQLQEFIFKQIITLNDHLLPQNHKHKNHWDQLQFLCKQHFDQKPKLILEIDENKLKKIDILLNEEVIASHSSVSYKYAKKKAITLATKSVSDVIEQQITKSEAFKTNQKIKAEKAQLQKEQEKSIVQQKHIARNLAHQQKMLEKQAINKTLSKETDRKRREAKQKENDRKALRKGANTIYKEYTQEEISAMSVSKRRNLQDKGIIPKGTNF